MSESLLNATVSARGGVVTVTILGVALHLTAEEAKELQNELRQLDDDVAYGIIEA